MGNKVIKGILCAVLVLLICVFAVYNYFNNESFFSASLVNIITIVIALFVSFFLSQKTNDKRKQKDVILDLLFRFQKKTDSEGIYDFSSQTPEEILMRTRDINNIITILEEIKQPFLKEEDVQFVRKRFEEYRTLISDHITDLPYLRNSKKELKRPIELINIQITKMAIGLYNHSL